MKPIAIAFTLGLVAAVTVYGMAIAFISTLNRKNSMTNPLLSSNPDRDRDDCPADRSLADHIAMLQQTLENNEKIAKVLKTALEVGSPSAIADAKKLADAIISNSQNARG